MISTKGLDVADTAWKLSLFGVILVSIFPYSIRMRKNADQNNSEYGHFLRNVREVLKLTLSKWENTNIHARKTRHSLKSIYSSSKSTMEIPEQCVKSIQS